MNSTLKTKLFLATESAIIVTAFILILQSTSIISRSNSTDFFTGFFQSLIFTLLIAASAWTVSINIKHRVSTEERSRYHKVFLVTGAACFIGGLSIKLISDERTISLIFSVTLFMISILFNSFYLFGRKRISGHNHA